MTKKRIIQRNGKYDGDIMFIFVWKMVYLYGYYQWQWYNIKRTNLYGEYIY